ncbi:MAG: nucleoside deaminase [Rhodospirillales bacterium]
MATRTADFMRAALREAEAAASAGEVPVGAVIVQSGEILARAQNRVERDRDPTAHAEVLAIRAACRLLGLKQLPGAEILVTLEPCAMCAQAISLARLERLTFAAYDPKGGGVEHGARVFDHATCHHRPDVVGGLLEREAGLQLRRFFQGLRGG